MRKTALVAIVAGSTALSACKTYYGPDRTALESDAPSGPVYAGQDYDRTGNDCATFEGGGGDLLDPWLACTMEGREVLRGGFGLRSGDDISEKSADRVNIWFRRRADADHDLLLTDPEIRAALMEMAR